MSDNSTIGTAKFDQFQVLGNVEKEATKRACKCQNVSMKGLADGRALQGFVPKRTTWGTFIATTVLTVLIASYFVKATAYSKQWHLALPRPNQLQIKRSKYQQRWLEASLAGATLKCQTVKQCEKDRPSSSTFSLRVWIISMQSRSHTRLHRLMRSLGDSEKDSFHADIRQYDSQKMK